MNIKRILGMMALWLGVTFWITAPAIAQSGQATLRYGHIEPRPAVQNPLLKEPPKLTPELLARLEQALAHTHGRIIVPHDPSLRLETIRPTSPPTELNFSPQSSRMRIDTQSATFPFFRNTALNDLATNDATSSTNEPSLGVNGRVVFWSGNWYASVSGDGGRTFSYVNPFDNFPADGILDPVNGGFCCDQIVYYERTRGALFWLLQYVADANTNTQRIAVANSQADILNNNWFTYDFTPASFGFPASGYMLDFPDLSVSNNFLYLTTNVFLIGSPTTSTAVLARLPLNEMSQGLSINWSYIVTDLPSLRGTHGATTTMYFGAHYSDDEIRIYSVAENSGTVFWEEVNHDGFNAGTMTAPSPDGNDFAAFADSRILVAWINGGVLGFMWNAAQGGDYPYPYVELLGVRESDLSYHSQRQIWSETVAWLYPSGHLNDRGHVGGTIAFGGGTYYPGAAAWIADDINGTVFAPLEYVVFSGGDAGPANNRWGDYLTARRHVPYGNTWVGSGFSLVGGPNDSNTVPRFVWFGRERDMPPANNTIYVDLANASGYEDGSAAHPYNTVAEGHFAALPGDMIIIRAGIYSERVTLSTETNISSEGGSAVIGQGASTQTALAGNKEK